MLCWGDARGQDSEILTEFGQILEIRKGRLRIGWQEEEDGI